MPPNKTPLYVARSPEHTASLDQLKQATQPSHPRRRKAALPALLASLMTKGEPSDPGTSMAATAVAAMPPSPQDFRNLGMLRCPQVLALTGWSRSTLYNRIADAEFPPGVPLGPRTVGWPAAEVHAYLAARIDARNARMQRQMPDPTSEASA